MCESIRSRFDSIFLHSRNVRPSYVRVYFVRPLAYSACSLSYILPVRTCVYSACLYFVRILPVRTCIVERRTDETFFIRQAFKYTSERRRRIFMRAFHTYIRRSARSCFLHSAHFRLPYSYSPPIFTALFSPKIFYSFQRKFSCVILIKHCSVFYKFVRSFVRRKFFYVC